MVDMTNTEAAELAPGTVVNILPDKNGCNYAHHVGWTVVGPTRHPYNVVVREPDYNTTMHIAVERLVLSTTSQKEEETVSTSRFDRKPDLEHVVLVHAERLTNTTNGNPRFRITFSRDGENVATHLLQSDAAVGYEVTNYLNSHKPINVWLTKAGRVEYFRPV